MEPNQHKCGDQQHEAEEHGRRQGRGADLLSMDDLPNRGRIAELTARELHRDLTSELEDRVAIARHGAALGLPDEDWGAEPLANPHQLSPKRAGTY